MNLELVSRLLLTVAIIGAGLTLYWLVNKISLVRSMNQADNIPAFRPGKPAIVYFTTPTCAPCKTIQRPAIESIKKVLGEKLQVIEIDASEQTQLAKEWGVISVPTTYVLNADGKPRHVNHGVAPAAKLIQQLEIEDFEI
jgi:thioredoxin-like negative regulator of GroEL